MTDQSSTGGAAPLASPRLASRFWNLVDHGSMRFRIPMFVAIESVVFERWLVEWFDGAGRKMAFDPAAFAIAGAIAISGILALFEKTARLAMALFIAAALIGIAPQWVTMPNHIWLALWAIVPAVLFREWWQSSLYSLYLRVTLGMVMLAAFSQKILAGTYVDGSYITVLSRHGQPTERMFAFLCDIQAATPCLAHQAIGLFILAWQLSVGILLIAGLRSILFLIIEIGFLLGAGLFADEMNFQVLNIALLCIIFRVGMGRWLLAVCALALLIDTYGISNAVKGIMSHVS